MSPDDIVVTGLGMVSSLGHDVETACAASRAGLSRPSARPSFRVASDEEPAGAPLVVHAVPDITRGFEGRARRLRLLEAGLADLQRQAPDGPWTQGPPAFYLSLPDGLRIHDGIERLPEEDREPYREAAANAGPAEPALPGAALLLREGLRLSRWPGHDVARPPPADLRAVSTAGTPGVIEMCERATSALRGREITAAVVGGVDSLLDDETLQWLEATGRLKTPALAAGLAPGEAAAFFVLERAATARARGAHLLAVVESLAFAVEADNLLSARMSRGAALAEVLTAAAPAARWKDSADVWLVTDQNGEVHRAHEWGSALSRLVARDTIFRSPRLWYPAVSFGDTGAAFGGVAMSLAIRAFARGYAPFPLSTITCSAESSMRAAAVIADPRRGL